MTTRRRNLWVSLQTRFVVLNNTSGAIDLLQLNLSDNRGQTVTREIIRLTARHEGDETAGEITRIRYGLIMMNVDQAVASAFPDPEVPDQADWLMLDHIMLTVPVLAEDSRFDVGRFYDLSGQRKIGNQDASLYLVFRNEAISGSSDVNIEVTSRILMKMA